MSELETLHVFRDDYPAAQAWELVDWCRLQGADEFTLFGIVCQGLAQTALEPFDRAAAPYKLPSALRRIVNAPEGAQFRDTELWTLTPETVAALHLAFPRTPFSYIPDDAWFEDLILYRRHEVMLGVITHEAEGVLRVTHAERQDLEQRQLRYRAAGKHVAY